MELIDRLLANDLADLAGLEIKGTIPIKEELANELVTSYMNDFFVETAPVAKSSSDAASDYIKLLKKLKPTLLEISFEAGKAVVDFELKR